MGFNKKLLSKDEYVVRHMREHVKGLFGNILALIMIIVAVILVLLFAPESLSPWLPRVAVITGAILTLFLFLIPWLQWFTATYTITSRRIITRSGILKKTGHDIPLTQISNVSYELDLIDRVFGCGTLILETSAENPLYLHDIPQVEKIHVQLMDLLHDAGTGD